MDRRGILFLCDDATQMGGVQRVIANLADLFERHGYRVSVLSLAERGEAKLLGAEVERSSLFDEGWLAKALLRLRVGGFHLRGRRLFKLRPLAQRKARGALRRWVADRDIEAVIIFDTFMAQLAGRAGLHGTKIIVQYHNSFSAIAGTKEIERLRRAVKHASRFLALTRGDALEFKVAGIGDGAYVSNPLSFYPDSLPIERQRRVVAMGRFHHQKAFDELVRAWAALRDRRDWTLHLHGDGPDLSKIQQAIKSHGVRDSVVIHGPTDQAQEVLSRASIFALSSRYEGLCMVAMEAMACGTPIVSTRSGPGTEELVDGCGLLSGIGDTAAFARNLQKLIDDGGLRERLSRRGREKALRYSPEVILQAWESQIASAPAVGTS